MPHRTPLHRIPLRVAAALLLATTSLAAPSLDEVIEGDVTFHQDGSLTVITASDGAILHYDSFDIFVDEVVRFVQPGERARVLNRVFGDATRIEGTLRANGIVYIVNPAGIFIDGEAVVEVGGLVAAAGHIENEDFLAGIDRFDLTGPVESWSDDVRAERVALLGRHVANFGEVHAPDGTIALVAGDRVMLTRLGGRVFVEVDGPPETAAGPGVVQAGLVDAGGGQVVFAVGDHYSLAINHEGITRGGDVDLRGGDEGVVLVRGEIDASRDGPAGSIDVTGDRVALMGATLDASGASGGGSIHVGGERRGEGETARRTFVDSESVLRADAVARGDGGEIVVWGDEAAVFEGVLSARGGAGGGNGGFAEISSLGLLRATGSVDLRAPAGTSGTLLFDPQDIVIRGGTLDGDDTPDMSDANLDPASILFDDDLGTDPFTIHESEIEGTDANIVLEARHSITVAGTFDNAAAGEGEGVVVVMPGNDLTLRTRNAEGDDAGSAMDAGIDLADTVWQTSGGAIAIETGTADEGVDAGITVGDVTSGGGNVLVATTTGDVAVGDVDTSGANGDVGGDAGIAHVRAFTAGNLAVGSVSATGGDGSAGAGGAGGGVEVSSALGDVTLGDVDTSGGHGLAGAGGAAGEVRVQTLNGDVVAGSVTATGGAGGAEAGGNGAQVVVGTLDGTTQVGAIDASGGDGVSSGGIGGFVSAEAGDADASGTSSVTVEGDVTSRGGAASAGAGGSGGRIQVQTFAAPADPDAGDEDPPMGGGPVSVMGDVDASGGSGSGNGGSGGRIDIGARVSGDVTIGDVTSRGGDADTDGAGDAENGGAAGSIFVFSDDGSIAAGAIDASGGAGSLDADDEPEGAGGQAGVIQVVAGAEGSGDATTGAIRAVDGAGTNAANPNRTVVLDAAGDVDIIGVAPEEAHIQTTEQVTLRAGGSLNGGAPLRIDAVGVLAPPAPEPEDPEDPPPDPPPFPRTLVVEAGSLADVDVTTAGFTRFDVTATSAGAGIDVTQAAAGAVGSDVVIDIDGDLAGGTSTIAGVNTLDASFPDEVDVRIALLDALEGDDDEHVTLAVADAAALVRGDLVLVSEDDVVLGSGAIAVTPSDPNAPSADVVIDADADGDGDGAIVAGAAGTHIDMNDGENPTGDLVLQAGSGIGAPGAPIQLEDADRIGAGVTTSGGIHLRQTQGGELLLSGGGLDSGLDGPFEPTDAVAILAGDGDIDVENQAGSLILLGDVRTSVDGGATGSIRLAASGPPDAAVRFAAPGGSTVDSAGEALIDGALELTADGTVDAVGDVTFAGTVDSVMPTTRNLTASSESGVVRFRGDVGSAFELRNLTVDGATLLDPSAGSAMSFSALQTLDFAGGVDATGDDAASLAASAGNAIRFGGNVGGSGRLTGLSVDAPSVTFDGDGAQTVLTGALGIGFNTPDGLPAPPELANVGKAGGDLRLESVGGDVDFGPNQKLTVDGVAELVGDSVILGDANALELHVDATSAFRVRARPDGTFVSPGVGSVPDGGTDLFANVITTTVAPEVGGSGSTPRFVTASGSLDGAGAGALPVVALSRPVTSEQLVELSEDGETFFDLGLPVSDPGNETEPAPPPVAPLLPARPGDEAAAGSAQAPSAETVLDFLRCADASPDDPRGCAPSDGSPLDSERGEDLAARYRRLFGSAPEAPAAQRLLRTDAPERSAVLRDVATFLAQLRLLGMEASEYERLRDRLLERAVGAERSEEALAAVRGHARGLPL